MTVAQVWCDRVYLSLMLRPVVCCHPNNRLNESFFTVAKSDFCARQRLRRPFLIRPIYCLTFPSPSQNATHYADATTIIMIRLSEGGILKVLDRSYDHWKNARFNGGLTHPTILIIKSLQIWSWRVSRFLKDFVFITDDVGTRSGYWFTLRWPMTAMHGQGCEGSLNGSCAEVFVFCSYAFKFLVLSSEL